jgi:tetratricopeptide (TPR) repeat protein
VLTGALLLVAVGCARGQVVRVFGGVERPGRFISEVAYATYARGAEREAAGELQEALGAYEHAAMADPESVEAHTRIGALRCRLSGAASARTAFERATEIDPGHEPLWSARARCASEAGGLPEAIGYARRAFGLEPEEADTGLLLAELLAASGARSEALRLLVELGVRSPASQRVWQALYAHAVEAGDAAWRAQAARRLDEIRGQLEPTLRPDPELASAVLGQQLRRGELEAARRTARRGRLEPHALAVRALGLGRPALAREEAALRAAADPADGDAHVAWALAADRQGDRDEVDRALAPLTSPRAPLTPLGRDAAAMLAELLGRHLGAEAAATSGAALGDAVPAEVPGEPAPPSAREGRDVP